MNVDLDDDFENVQIARAAVATAHVLRPARASQQLLSSIVSPSTAGQYLPGPQPLSPGASGALDVHGSAAWSLTIKTLLGPPHRCQTPQCLGKAPRTPTRPLNLVQPPPLEEGAIQMLRPDPDGEGFALLRPLLDHQLTSGDELTQSSIDALQEPRSDRRDVVRGAWQQC